VWLDLRFAVRTALKRPVAAAAVVAILGCSIAAATVLGAVFDAIVGDVPPVAEPDTVVRVWRADEARPAGHRPASHAEYQAWLASTRTLDDLTAFASGEAMLGDVNAETISVLSVTPQYFRLAGRAPQIGRTWTDAEDEAPVAVISDRLWRRRFNADRAIVGRAIRAQARAVVVLGVMPRGFWFPARATDLWVPLARGDRRDVDIGGRLRPGASRAEASAEFDVLAARSAVPGDANRRALVRSVADEARIRIGPGLRALVAPAIAILLIACANVANLLIMRAVVREREFAIRAALGATAGRLARLTAVEAAALAAAGGASALLLAPWGVSLFRAALAGASPELADAFQAGGTVAAIAGGCTAVSMLLTALWPVVAARRRAVAVSLAGRSGGLAFDRHRYGIGDLLVVLQVALAIVLVLVSVFVVRFMHEVTAVETPADGDRVLIARLVLASDVGDRARRATIAQVLDDVQSVPGVAIAALSATLPARTEAGLLSTVTSGGPDGTSTCHAHVVAVSRGYFAALGLPLRWGAVPGGGSAIASVTAAERCWGTAAAGAWQVRVGDREPWLHIAGVADDPFPAKALPLGSTASYIWIVDPPAWPGDVYLLARAASSHEAGEVAPKLADAVAFGRSSLAIERPLTIADRVRPDLARSAVVLQTLVAVAALALLLAFTGVYAVMSQSCARRLVEFGVRLAIGASPRRLAVLALEREAPLVVAGVAVGVLGTLVVTAVVWRDLLVVCALDARVWIVTSAVIAAAAFLAAAGPASRAARVDPVVLLRAE
jgi:putative ABC transport system permease protein